MTRLSLWAKIRDWTNKGHLVVRVYYRPPDQGKPVDEAFLLQLQEMPHLQALTLRCLLRRQHNGLRAIPEDSWNLLRITSWSRYWTDTPEVEKRQSGL